MKNNMTYSALDEIKDFVLGFIEKYTNKLNNWAWDKRWKKKPRNCQCKRN